VGGSSITVADNNPNLAANAFSLAVMNSGSSSGDIYIAAIGGQQTTAGYNADSALQSVAYPNIGAAKVRSLMSVSATFPYEFRDISFKGTTAYVLAGTYGPGQTPTDPWVMNGQLFSTTDFTNLSVIDTIAAAPGYLWSAQYTPDNNRLWYAHGNDIRVYDAGNLPQTVGTAVHEQPERRRQIRQPERPDLRRHGRDGLVARLPFAPATLEHSLRPGRPRPGARQTGTHGNGIPATRRTPRQAGQFWRQMNADKRQIH
jgi:hypothetical protein